METLIVKISSSGPMLMHACTLADPLHDETKAHKALTGKRKKTDEDHEAIAKSEWTSSLYIDDEMGPYLPGINIESCLFEAAKLRKLGKIMKRALFVSEDKVKIEYRGPRTKDAMFKDKRFVDARPVKVSMARLIRYRPKFDDWTAQISVMFNPEQIDKGELVSVLHDAGSLVGLGDFRPRFGKFSIEVIK
jgi:hypothetical protein